MAMHGVDSFRSAESRAAGKLKPHTSHVIQYTLPVRTSGEFRAAHKWAITRAARIYYNCNILRRISALPNMLFPLSLKSGRCKTSRTIRVLLKPLSGPGKRFDYAVFAGSEEKGKP